MNRKFKKGNEKQMNCDPVVQNIAKMRFGDAVKLQKNILMIFQIGTKFVY